MKRPETYSYWEKDSFLRPYDLVVIGAGIVGLSSALFYKKDNPEARILVIDKGWIPEGASTRNAGFACVGSITEHLADMDKETDENIRDRIKIRYEGLQRLRNTLGEQEIGYVPCGGYELFTRESEFQFAKGHIEQFNNWLSEMTGESEVYKTDRLNGYDVIRNRLEGALHPGKLMQALIRKVTQSGIEIKWNTRVTAVTGDGEVVFEPGIPLEPKRILIASNGFTKRLIPDIEIKPARGYVILSNEQKDLKWRGTFHHDRGYIYFRNVGNRLLLGGGRNIAEAKEQTDDFGANEEIRSHLVQFANDVLHMEKDWTVTDEWSGIMGFTSTKTPVVKQLDEYRYIVAGLSGMGVAIGMEIGKRASDLLH